MADFKYEIESFLRTGVGDFEDLAMKLFHYQFEANRPYHAFCQAQNFTPKTIERWQDIPAVSIGAFKSNELATFAVGQAAAIFESSATTTGIPSRHYIKDLRYYEASLKTSFAKHVTNSRALMLILTPPPSEAPRSSLSWMMDVVKRTWGAPGSRYFVQRGRLDELWLATMLAKVQASQEPVILLGTTIAFLNFFDWCETSGKRFKLSSQSRLMDTGGMKTQKREISRPAFVQKVGEILAISEEACINEYGMCELGSQFYGRGASSYLEGPPWTRTLVIDPLTGNPASIGKPGLLRHFDLANVDSVFAIQTEDVGVSERDGFVFQGRDPAADLKGCSLAAESFLK